MPNLYLLRNNFQNNYCFMQFLKIICKHFICNHYLFFKESINHFINLSIFILKLSHLKIFNNQIHQFLHLKNNLNLF